MVEVGEGTSWKSLEELAHGVWWQGWGLCHCEDVCADLLLSRQLTHATHRAIATIFEHQLYAKYSLTKSLFWSRRDPLCYITTAQIRSRHGRLAADVISQRQPEAELL